jgi:hypothetical protein
MTATRLVLPPTESARLAAAAPGEVVEVRCGEPLPRPAKGLKWLVSESGRMFVVDADRNTAPFSAQPSAVHPAPAVGAEVWVPNPIWTRLGAYHSLVKETADAEELADADAYCSKCEWVGVADGNPYCPLCDSEVFDVDALTESDLADLRATVTAVGAAQWCPACGGRGFEEDEADTCYKCDGEGRKMACPDDLCRGAGECIHADGYVSCRACKGLGEIYDPCPTCQGTPPWWPTVSLRREP